MRKLLIAGAAACALCGLGAVPANAFIPVQSHLIAAHAAQGDVVTAKWKRHRWKHHKWKHRPAGWSRGKAWWKRGGRSVPPGQR